MAIAALALLALAGCATTGPQESEEIAALERAFWHCDYAATTGGVLATPMAACQHATNELKARKFGGSFAAMTAWWHERRRAEHDRLAR